MVVSANGIEYLDWIGDRTTWEIFVSVDFVEVMYPLRQVKSLQTYCRWALIRSYNHVATPSSIDAGSETRPDFKQTPSGWAPPLGRPAPPGVQPEVPFRVVRSRYGNLPVYLDYKSGGSRVLTIIRKVEGDTEALEKMLRAHLRVKGLLSRADSLIGSVTLNGDFKNRTVAWLRTMGF